MCDIKRWTVLSLLSNEFIENVQSAIIFGSSGSEAILLTKNDELYGIGSNNCSCLGTNKSQGTLEPCRIDELCGRGIISLAFGSGPHVLALSQDGRVFAWGHNAFGQLGTASKSVGISPVVVGDILAEQNVVQIACGNHHSVAVTDRGQVFTWGRNSCGQLGNETNVNQDRPILVAGALCGQFVQSVSCGQNHTLALTNNGEIFAWGFNGNGQLGIDCSVNQSSPIQILSLAGIVIKQISCGFAHSLALSDEGQLFAWGSNTCCQLSANLPRTNQLAPILVEPALGRIVDIAAVHACNITVVVNTANKVYMWGQVRGQTAEAPIETRFESVVDVFACFANPAVSCRLLSFEAKNRCTVLDAIRSAFDNPATGDLKISVDGHVIHAHKALLRMRCAYFRSRFREQWCDDENSSIVEVSHYSYTVYRSFLRWLYTDELLIDLDDAISLLDLANCYCETELRERCIDIIKKGITVENVALFYNAALRLGLRDLEEFSFQFAMHHMTAVAQSEAFTHMEESAVKQFILNAAKNGAFKN